MNSINNRLASIIFIVLIIFLSGCNSVQSINNEHVSSVSSFDGSSITYGVSGQGKPTLVFVHCWTCDHEFWTPQIDYFSKKHKVVWLDLAGHGLSVSNRQAYTMPAFGKDVAAVVNALNIDNVILIGHSMGGPVAVEAAEILGDKVIGIVGVDTFYTPFEYPKSEAQIEAFVKPFEKDFKNTSEQLIRSMFTANANPELINATVQKMTASNQGMGINAMYELFRWNANNVPSKLNKYANKHKNINAAPTGKEIALHKSVTLVPGVGHFIAQAKPIEFNKVLDKIIAQFRTD